MAAKRFYNRPAWRRLRLVKLSESPLCEMCARAGRVTLATEVDHITPMSAGGEGLDMANLQSLCKSCHSIKTGCEQTGKPMKGCDADGKPLDPSHWWNAVE